VINCRDCAQALNPYIDRELSDEDVIQVRGHLEACGGCLHLYHFEESLRRLVRVRCQEQGAPDSLRERITATLARERMRQERFFKNPPTSVP
jgi:mycothiol system anti-sigma-R factor